MTKLGEGPPAGSVVPGAEPNSNTGDGMEVYRPPFAEYRRLRAEGKTREEAIAGATASLNSEQRQEFENLVIGVGEEGFDEGERERVVEELSRILESIPMDRLTEEERGRMASEIESLQGRPDADALRTRLSELAGPTIAAPGAPRVMRVVDAQKEMEALGATVQAVEAIGQGGKKQIQSIGLLPHDDGRVEVLRIRNAGRERGYEVLRKGEFYVLGDGQLIGVGKTSKFSLTRNNSGTFELVPATVSAAPTTPSAAPVPSQQEVQRLSDEKKALHDRIDALRGAGVNETVLNVMWGSIEALSVPGKDSSEILRRAGFELTQIENMHANGTLGALAGTAVAPGGTNAQPLNSQQLAAAVAAALTTPAVINALRGAGVVQQAPAAPAVPQQPGQGAAAAPTQQPAAPVGTPNTGTLVAAPAPGTFRASQVANGQTVQIGPAPGGAGGFLVRTPQGWSHYPTQAAAQAAFQAAVAQAPAPGVPPQPAVQPPAAGAQPAAPVVPGQAVHIYDQSLPSAPQGFVLSPDPNHTTPNGVRIGQDANGQFWVHFPGTGNYYLYRGANPTASAQRAMDAMHYYANAAPAHAAAMQLQAGPGGTLQQAMSAAPQAAQRATQQAMRSIRTILAQERERLTGQHGKVLGFFRFLWRWEYGLTFAAGAGAGAVVGALTAASGGLGVAGAAKLGAAVSLARSALEARLARRILGEEAAREQAAGNTARANEVLRERDDLRLLSRENVMSTVLVNGLIGAAGGAFGNWFLNQTPVGQSIKNGIASAGKWILGIANTPPAPAGAAVAAAAAVNNAPPPGPGVNSGWAPTGNKLAGVTTINKLPGRAPGASAAAFVNGPRRVPVAPYDVYVRGGSRVRTQVIEEAVRMRFKGKAGLQQFIDMFGYDPRPGKVAYVPRGPQSMYVEPTPQNGTRIFVQPPGGPKSMYVLPPEGVAPAPRLSTVPYIIGGDESVWSFAQQEMQKGVLSRAAEMLPPNLHESFINAMHDTLDKTPKFKSVLLGIPDAANLQWNKIPNGTKVDFAALLSNQEFLDEFRKTATSLRYGSLWRALTQNGNSPEKFFALVRSLYVPAPARAGGIIA